MAASLETVDLTFEGKMFCGSGIHVTAIATACLMLWKLLDLVAGSSDQTPCEPTVTWVKRSQNHFNQQWLGKRALLLESWVNNGLVKSPKKSSISDGKDEESTEEVNKYLLVALG